jgi:ribosome-associated toxin RatA of RatAB toxin-antitoxin module
VISTTAIDVSAPPDLVFRLAADVTRWPDLLPHYVAARVERVAADGSRVVRFVARREIGRGLAPGLRVAWRARTSSDPATRRLQFAHIGGATAGMAVTWRIDPRDGGSHVEIEHRFGPRLAIWAPIVERLFVAPIAARTLATFKAIAEAVVEVGGATAAGPGVAAA